jgi:hypothetical protein
MKYWLYLVMGLLFGFTCPNQIKADNANIQDCCDETCSGLYYEPLRFYVAGIVGEGFGHDTRRASAGLFYAPNWNCKDFFQPLFEGDCQPFFDIRGHYLSNNRWAANAGVGMRCLDPCLNYIWGANIYYDYRDGISDNFNQIGIGLEALGPCLDLRFNAYFPVGSKTHSRKKVFDNFIGDFVMTCREKERANKGFNFEAGSPFYQCGCWELYGALGTYYYRHPHHDQFWGGSARVALRYTEYLTIEARITYDKFFRTKAQGFFVLNIPFSLFDCDCQADPCNSALWQPVVRNDVIILDRSCCWSQNF